MLKPTIFIAGDHAAFEMKKKIVAYLKKKGYTVKDFGPHRYNPDDDYPDFVIPMARAVAQGHPLLNPPPHPNPSPPGRGQGEGRGRKKVEAHGIALGGSGIGECIAANKVRGVRAVRAWNVLSAKMSRLHNNTNVLCLGGGKTKDPKAHGLALSWPQTKKIIAIWLATEFSGEKRHVRRLGKINIFDSHR